MCTLDNMTGKLNYKNRTYNYKGVHRFLELCYSAPRGGRNPGNNDGHWVAVDEQGDVTFTAWTRKELVAKIDRDLDMTPEEAAALLEEVEIIRKMLAN